MERDGRSDPAAPGTPLGGKALGPQRVRHGGFGLAASRTGRLIPWESGVSPESGTVEIPAASEVYSHVKTPRDSGVFSRQKNFTFTVKNFAKRLDSQA